MTRATKQLSGAGKDRFFKHFFDEENSLEPEVAKKLAEKSAKTFSSVRVRGAAFDAQRAAEAKAGKARPAAKPEPPKKSKPAKIERTPVTSERAEAASLSEPELAQTTPPPAPAEPAAPFDAYSIGLVPTCQREGPEGLMAKLADIASTDNLREMARLQRIVIPSELRKGEAEPQAVREAIVSAVAKSIADKKTAAG